MKIQNISAYNNYNNPRFTAIKPRKKIPNLAQPHIDNCEHGFLPQEIQKFITHIQENWMKIKDYFDALKTKPIKAAEIRRSYEPLIRRSNKQGLTFKTPDTEELVTVLQSRNSDNKLLRFIIESNGTTSHLLVDTPDKLIKNIDPNAPYVLPPKFRYMTDTEIQSSGISRYAEFADSEIEKYSQYLEKYDEVHPRQKSGPKVGYKRKTTPPQTIETPKPVEEIKPHTVKEILDIFRLSAKDVPPHINPIISPKSGQILGLKATTSEGNTLTVLRSMLKENRCIYLSFAETLPNGTKKHLNVDIETFEILKTNFAGKPVVEDGIVEAYTQEEAIERGITQKLEKYLNEIFTASNNPDQKSEITVLQTTKKSVNNPKIEEINISEIEDSRLNKLLDKEETNLD